ncbi:MAG: Ig-like domain-containing protein [Bacteroidaceae bacterium]|nr:Ig-like domain-containing protein [Bacteroidaceae bacterium]
MRKVSFMIVAFLCALFVVQAQAGNVQLSVTMPDVGKPEHVYTVMNGNNVYVNALTAPTQTAENYGLFAFYQAEVEGACYIYSYKAKKWLTYTKSASYSNGRDFVKLSDTKVEGAYFKVDNYAGDNYSVQPYTTSGGNDKYLNYNGGLDFNPLDGNNTLGLWQDPGSKDAGSRYTLTEVIIVERTYTINIPDGQTLTIGDVTYKNGDKYTIEGSVNKGDITVVAPAGKFAAVAVDDEACTINVYFATLPTQPATVAYTNAVLYPAQQTAVGAAKSEEKDGVYTLSNNVLAASFMRLGDAIYFAGSEAMDLVAGTEPFTVAFGAGDNVPASAMTLKSLELVDLEAKEGAIGGAEHYAGKALVANYEYFYKDSLVAIEWRAVLRDGSHYLRTEMVLEGKNDVDMFNVIPMIYNVDTKKAGSTPAVVGNTRGAVLMSNKIFAGLETPTAYNTVGGATGEEDNWNLTTTVPDVALTAASWVQLTQEEADVVKRVEEATGATYPNLLAYKQTNIELKKDQKVEVKVQYKSGSHRLNFGGADLLAENGDIAASDYHKGHSGSSHDKNTFTFTVPYDGTFTVRVIVENKSESIDATSTLTTKIYTAKEGVVINTDVVGIQGRWSRNTTLAKDETWKVAAVVGLIAQDGTQANADIHTTQKRRSFLAYSERERAVPWRAMPMYLTWYELQINRNNADPGREHLDNTKVDDVLDVLSHWKSYFYDRYGVSPEIFIIDDGWDKYGEWTFHESFPNEMRDMSKLANEMGAGIGAWLGPVGGYGASGNHRRAYWSDKGGMQLSNPRYYKAFKDAAFNLVCNQDGETGYQQGNDNYVFFKFDGISGQFSSVGPDAGDVGNENAEGIIRLEQYVREELREDIFFNTSVGTWASPFWYQITDATWRQENDHGRVGDNSINRENWITYRDELVYRNYVTNSPICPINTLMTHGFIFTKFGPPAGDSREYIPVRNELRAAFLCGSGMVELYNDYDLMDAVNGGALWADLAECIAWQKRNADVLPDAHWVGGNPWTGSKAEVYGWAAWNGTKSSLALRNGANAEQTYKFTLRKALNIPANVKGSIILRSAFGDQAALEGLTEGTAIDIDTELTVKLPGSSIYGFEGIDAAATVNKVESITLTTENDAKSVEVNKTLVVTATPNDGVTFPAIEWTSSNLEVARVQGGLVIPVKEGEVTITATAKDGSGLSASVTITVTPKVMEPGAEVTNLSELSNDKVYTIRSARAFLLYSEVEGLTNTLCTSNGKKVGSVTYSLTDPNLQFRIEKQGDNYYLYSVGAGKYVSSNGGYEETASTVLKMEYVGGTYPWKLVLGSNGLNSQDKNQADAGIVVNSWTTTDAGNCYQIVEAIIPGPDTNIGSVVALPADEAIYDLQGRRVSNPTKGVYIQGGKKIVLR